MRKFYSIHFIFYKGVKWSLQHANFQSKKAKRPWEMLIKIAIEIKVTIELLRSLWKGTCKVIKVAIPTYKPHLTDPTSLSLIATKILHFYNNCHGNQNLAKKELKSSGGLK
jgi:hypothetical protein